MKHYFLTVLACLLLLPAGVLAQNEDPVLISVGKEKITKSEFVKAYNKNNDLKEAKQEELREYLELYINYRLKVLEAGAMQLDTSKSFINELASYKHQSAQQYLVDTEVSDQILDEAFARSKYHIRASHILVRCPMTASPKDTLAAYNKIMQVRGRIADGLDFNDAAVQYSEDESARDMKNPQNGQVRRGNRGDLGYFTVLELIYPFENGAYGTPVGKVSMPVRTQFGYHLIYVQDKVPAMAKIYVSQIFIKDSTASPSENNPDISARLREIERQYETGEASFETLVEKFSDDETSKSKGGAMQPFMPNRRPGNYVNAVIKLRPGEISRPIPTALGWHVLRLDSVIYATVNEDSKYIIKNRLSHDARSQKSKDSFIAKLKAEYGFREDGKKAVFKFFRKNLPDNYFQSTEVCIDSLKGIGRLPALCTFADRELTARDFGKMISRYKGMTPGVPVMDLIGQLYPRFVQENLMKYENGRLEDKYPDYRDLVKEFHDGMLLYEINSRKIWNVAVEDSVGLHDYYEKIKEQFPCDGAGPEGPYKPMAEVRAAVISQYQDYLEKEWMKELHVKYPVKVDEDVYRSVLNSRKP